MSAYFAIIFVSSKKTSSLSLNLINSVGARSKTICSSCSFYLPELSIHSHFLSFGLSLLIYASLSPSLSLSSSLTHSLSHTLSFPLPSLSVCLSVFFPIFTLPCSCLVAGRVEYRAGRLSSQCWLVCKTYSNAGREGSTVIGEEMDSRDLGLDWHG